MALSKSGAEFTPVSTVMEIKAAIERLTPAKRVKLHALVWPEEDEGFTTPPRVREKLAEAARGTFAKRDRRILQSIE